MLTQMSQTEFILRGGGCGSWKVNYTNSGISMLNNQNLQNFFKKFNFYVEQICSKAVVAANSSESQEIMMALQWFKFQEENIYSLNKNAQSLVRSYDLIFGGIQKLLNSCLIYIRTDSFKCLQILQTTASLSKVIFSFHVINEERFMKCDVQKIFLDLSDEIRLQMEIEKNDFIQNQMELYLFLTKTSFEIAPNNGNEREEILKGCLSGIISSISQMKPNEELLQSLFQGAFHLYKQYVINNHRKQYEVYFQIDMLQWEIISYFKSDKLQTLEEIISQVEEVYDKIVKNSNDWKYHYLWVQMIGNILQYNPLLTKFKFSQLINTENIGANSDQIWKEYQRKGLLIQMNHSNDQAVILLNQFKNKQLSQIDRMILKTCFKEWDIFLLLKDFLINEKHQNISFTFGSYLKSKLEIQGQELQQNVNLVAINNIKRFVGILVSNKLLILIRINTEKLEEAIKLCRNFTQDKQYDENLKLKILSQQIQKIIQNLDIYLQNTQVILKIMGLNQSKQRNRKEVNNFEKFNKLLRLQQILQLYIILDQDQDQGSQTQHQKKVIDNNDIEEWRKLILDELNNIDFKEDKFVCLQLTSTLQNNKKKIRGEVENLIEKYQKEIQKLELFYLQNNFLQYFQNLVNNLHLNYENKCNEFQNHFSEFNKYLLKIMIIKSKIETAPSRVELKKVKLALSDLHLLKFLEKLRQSNLKLKLNLIASKKLFSFLMEKAKSEELRKLSEIINLNGFLLNVIEEFPERIMSKMTNFDRLIYTELQNIVITGDDFQFRLSKQKGIIKFLLFKQSLIEKQIDQVGKDLELFEKEFGDQFIKESSSLQKIKEIFIGLKVDKSIEKVIGQNLNSLEIKQEKEKYEMFLSRLQEIEDFRKCLGIENWNQLKLQTETVIQTLEKFGCPNKKIFSKLINLELNQLQTIISQSKINYEEQQVQISPIIHERVDIADNDKCCQIVQIYQIDLEAGKSENVVDTNQNGYKFNFSSDESYKAYLSFIAKVVKLKKLIIKEEMVLLSNLLEEVAFFSSTFNQIEKYEKEIQTEFEVQFQDGIKEFIQKLEQLQFSYVNLQQKKDENFHSYLESLETKLFNKVNDQVPTQIKINIFDFLDSLEFYLQEKLAQKKCFSNIQIEQDFLIQQIKKLYCEESCEEFEEKEESNLIDNLVLRFQDFTNNEQWKIKQGLVFTIIQISTNCFSDSITSFCQEVLIQLWVQEKDQRVRNFLKNQQLISIQMQILSKDWSTQHDGIAKKMQEMLRRIDELQEQISHEANLNKRDLFLKELDETTEQLDQQIENISEMGQQLRLIIDFVNQIRKGLIRIEGKINEMKEQLNTIGNDIKFLRGKSVQQLFEIRKWKVLKEAAYKNVKTIYVPLQTLEIFHEQENVKVKSSIFMNFEDINDRGGEVNEFLLQELPEEKKTVLLIHGQAGSGKSTAAKKIEEFIWKLHNNNQKIRNQVLIPVYISLPSLKNPVFQAVEEALCQDEYGFDQLQLKECKELLEKKEFKLLLIMDSYDELKLEHIQKNLYQSNKVNQIWSNPLVIFTTRSEIFTNSNYTTWFQPDKKQELKEIQLKKFNETQMKEYLKKYTTQTIKMFIFEIYEWQIQISNRGAVDINKFDIFWEKFIFQFQRSEVTNGENLLNEKQIESIQQLLKDDEFIMLKSTEALRSLKINLQKLWSIEKFEKMIQNINLYKLVETPYLMEIVVQVLPDMLTKATEINNVKQNFFFNFPNMLKAFYKSKFLMQMHKMQHLNQLINENENELQSQNQNVTFTDLENLETIKYHEITQAIWNLQEENLTRNTKEKNDLKANLVQINLSIIHKLSNNAFKKIAVQEETIIQVVCDALQEYNLTSYDFYEEFVNQYHLKQIEKLKNIGKSINMNSFAHDLKKYSIEFANNMSFRQVTQVQYQQKGLLYYEENFEEEWLNQFFNYDCKNGNYKKDVRSCSLIRQKGENFQFVHKSIQEFLIAQDIYEVLILSQNLNPKIFHQIREILGQQLNNLDSIKFLDTQKNYESYLTIYLANQLEHGTHKIMMKQTVNLLQILKKHNFSRIDYSSNIYTETKKFLIQKIQKKEQIIELLKFLVFLTAIDHSFITCGSNSLNLLVQMQVDLTRHNFEKIRIKNTSLIRGNFAQCNFSQSEFQNVNISGININEAQMFGCTWKELKINDLHSFNGHSSIVTSVNFSPDGTTLASGSGDNSIRLWDIKTGKQKAILDGHSNCIKQVCFSPDGITLASGSDDKSIGLWDVQTGLQKAKLDGHYEAVYSVNFSSDGTILASGSLDNSIRLWDVKTGQQKAQLDGHFKQVNSVNFSPDGATLASGSDDKSILFWDVKTGQAISKLDDLPDYIRFVNFSPDGETLASNYESNSIILWNVKTIQLKFKLEGHSSYINSANFSPDGTTLASGGLDLSILLWDVQTGLQKAKLIGHSREVFSVNFSPDGTILASCGDDNSISLWDAKVEQQKSNFNDNQSCIYSINFSPDGTTFVTGGGDYSIRLWDVKTGQQKDKLDGHSGWVFSVNFSPDGTTLASGSSDKSIRFWEVKTGKQTVKLEGFSDYIRSVCFSPDGATLASGSDDKSIRLWDIKTGNQKAILDGHSKWVFSVSFSPDGTILASGSKDKSIRLWDVRTGKQQAKLDGHSDWVYQINFSPDGTTLASGSKDKSICLWDVKTGQQKAKLDGFLGSIKSVCFSSDGATLASGSEDNYIRLWDVKTGQQAKLDGHSSQAFSVSFSPDGTILASGSFDNSIRLWDIKTRYQKAKLGAHLGRVMKTNFSPDGTTLAFGSEGSAISLWDVKTGQQILSSDNHYQNILAQFSPQIQNKNLLQESVTILLISQELVFQSQGALILKGEFFNKYGIDLRILFQQRGCCILDNYVVSQKQSK